MTPGSTTFTPGISMNNDTHPANDRLSQISHHIQIINGSTKNPTKGITDKMNASAYQPGLSATFTNKYKFANGIYANHELSVFVFFARVINTNAP